MYVEKEVWLTHVFQSGSLIPQGNPRSKLPRKFPPSNIHITIENR